MRYSISKGNAYFEKIKNWPILGTTVGSHLAEKSISEVGVIQAILGKMLLKPQISKDR